MTKQPVSVTVKVEPGREFRLSRTAVARISPGNCVNCGTCRAYCPVEAIHERQREICRICPDCTSQPALTFEEMQALPASRACTTACPLGISPQGYVNLIRKGKLEAAYKLIWDRNPLPAVCGRICHHPCEQDCKRGLLVDTPIAIRGLKRFLADSLPPWRPEPYPCLYEESVAVIGSGPAGLTAAHYLARAGYRVSVIDEATEPGGMLMRGLPPFRLPREVVKKEIQALMDAGIAFRLGEKVGKAGLAGILEEFEAVVVAAGAPHSRELHLPGWRNEGILGAIDFMERAGLGQDIERHPSQEFRIEGEVVVVGGGSVAIDTARTALRQGASQVTVVCLECADEIPCHAWERQEAEEEGITILPGLMPQRFLGVLSRVTGLEVCDVAEFRKDAAGQIHCSAAPGTERVIPADWVIVAIGQAPDELWKDVPDEYRVFFAGDVSSQNCSVIDAMASGRQAALEVDTLLRGRALKDPDALRTLEKAPMEEKIYPAVRLKVERHALPLREAASRVHDMQEIELGFDGKAAQVESQRCLACGYQEVDPERCIGCGVCQRVCPTGDAITLVAPGKED